MYVSFNQFLKWYPVAPKQFCMYCLKTPKGPSPQHTHIYIPLWKLCKPGALIRNFTVFFIVLLGLSPDLQSMEQIRRIMRPTDVPDTGKLV